MIFVETVIIGGKQYRRTYSDSFMLQRDGVEYMEAVDPVDSGRAYTEAATPLPEPPAEEVLAELLEVLR